MRATVLPALASRPAIGAPAWPAPMTMASKRRLIRAPTHCFGETVGTRFSDRIQARRMPQRRRRLDQH